MLYNKMLESNNQYNDFVETNGRYEVYQIERSRTGKEHARLLKPKEWTEGMEDEIYQLFETRLQTIEVQEQDIKENRTRTFRNLRLVWNRRHLKFRDKKL